MVDQQECLGETIQERMAEEELVQERIDEEGNRWRKVYFGGGEHFENWLAQCRELGEVLVEEVMAYNSELDYFIAESFEPEEIVQALLPQEIFDSLIDSNDESML